MLETWQYKAAKLIFYTNMTIPKSALFLELGWEPINDFLDRQRISYFSRLQNLPCKRLCKIVFDELKDSQSYPKWDYLNNVRRVDKLRPLPYNVWKTAIPIKFIGVPSSQI
jgi:hypothetical protein